MSLIKLSLDNMVENQEESLAPTSWEIQLFRAETCLDTSEQKIQALIKNSYDEVKEKIRQYKNEKFQVFRDCFIKHHRECDRKKKIRGEILRNEISQIQRILENFAQGDHEDLIDYAQFMYENNQHMEEEIITSAIYATILPKYRKSLKIDSRKKENFLFSLRLQKRKIFQEEYISRIRNIKPRLQIKSLKRKQNTTPLSLNSDHNRKRYSPPMSKNFPASHCPEITKEYILRNYPTICDFSENDKGYNGMQCEIPTEEGKKVVGKPYKNIGYLKEKVESEINNLLKKDIIRPTESQWINPIRPVVKKSGKIRLCQNLMALNSITLDDKEPMPIVEEIINKLQGSRYFTTIDMKEGFFQINLREKDKHKTAFQIDSKRYEFNRMPMGFKNSPFLFQRLMNHELREFTDKSVQVYLDDIIIFTRTEAEHNEILLKILEIFKKKNLKINLEKIQIKQKEINFLGYIINGDSVKIPECKKAKIEAIQLPKSKKELQRFLGSINYLRRFIPNYTEKTSLLYDMLKDGKEITDWSNDHNKCFNLLKEDVHKSTERYHPNFTRDFILECDASDNGVSAILMQKGDNGENKIIFPASKKLNRTEKNWGITEKEFFAVVFGIEKFQQYLKGRKFTIISDHKALTWIRSKENFGSAKIQRWIEKIMPFDFRIVYRPGSEMGIADDLSRAYKDDKSEKDDILITEQQKNLIIRTHDELGHRGAEATLYQLQKYNTKWPRQRDHVKQTLKECEICQRNKVKRKGREVFIESTRKFEIFGIDILETGENYVLLGIDFFTRKAYGSYIKNKKAETIRTVLNRWFTDNIFPEKIITDHGKEFANRIIKEWCEEKKVTHHLTSVEHPQSNGRIERLNRTIREMIRKQNPAKISMTLVKELIQKYNNTYHSAIKSTPNEAIINSNSKISKLNKASGPYAAKFKKKYRDKFIKDQIVAIKKFPHNKENVRYSKTGKIFEELGGDSYLVKVDGRLRKYNHYHMVELPLGVIGAQS